MPTRSANSGVVPEPVTAAQRLAEAEAKAAADRRNMTEQDLYNALSVCILSTDEKLSFQLASTLNEYSVRRHIHIDITVRNHLKDHINNRDMYNLIFVDDPFEHRSAVEAAKLCRSKDPKCAMIIMARTSEKVYDAFGLRTHRFLLKPVTQTQIFEAIDSYRKDFFAYRLIVTRIGNTTRTFSSEEIVFIEAEAKSCTLHLKEEVVAVSSSFSQVAVQLPSEYFFRTHRSFTVNMKHVREFAPDRLTMNTLDEVPLSRRRKVEFYMAYSQFVKGHSFL